MKKVVTVTTKDIAGGKKHKSKACPIALALKRNFPEAVEINAGYSLYVELPGSEMVSCNAPKTAIKFMAEFDAGEKVQPFKFAVNFS